MKRNRLIFCVSFVVILMLIIGCFGSAVATAEGIYQTIADFGKNNGIYAAETSNVYPWTVEADGSIKSSNANTASTSSVLVIKVKGSGVLTFSYKVLSTPKNNNSLMISTDSRMADIMLDTGITNKNNELEELDVSYDKYYSAYDWTNHAYQINAVSDDTITTVYFLYNTKGKAAADDDCAIIDKLKFSDGNVQITAVSNNESLGTVSGGGKCSCLNNVTLTATPKVGSTFFGWIANGKPVSYDAEYTFTPIDDITVTALFGDTLTTVARNTETGNIYSSVSYALSEASVGDVISVIRSNTIEESVTVPQGITLYIPYTEKDDLVGYKDGTTSESTCFANATREFVRLTVGENAILTVEGTLRIGAVIGYPGQYYQGHTSGSFGSIQNLGQIIVKKDAVIDSWGHITGSGTVSADSGATVYEPFVVFDYSGGTNTVDLNTAGQSPFSQYTMQNIKCTLEINYGAKLIGRCNLYADSKYNKTDAVIIGNSSIGGIIQLKNGSKLIRTVESGKYCRSYCSDIKTVKYEIVGGCSFEALTMTVMGVKVSTADVLFPIPYTYSYVLKNGEYDINTGIVVMPGAKIEAASNAALNVNERFFVLDGLLQDDMSGKQYPAASILTDSGYQACGSLIINGSLLLDKDYSFGGVIQSNTQGAFISTKPNNFQTFESNRFVNEVVLGAKTTYGNNYSKLQVNGRIRSGDELITLESGKEYKCISTKGWTLEEFKVLSYVVDGTTYGAKTVKASSDMKGSFVDESSWRIKGDLNNDGKVDGDDATALDEYLAGNTALDNAQKSAADVNGDGKVNSIDSTLLAQYLAGMISYESFANNY